MPETPALSLVVPLRDEADNVEALVEEIAAVLTPACPHYELILVDDGSTDGTWERVRRLQGADPARVVAVRFARNFGQSAAFTAGFAAARAPLVATMDGDRQNDPADLPAMMRLAETHDIVCGWRRHRQDDLLTRHLPSVAANWLITHAHRHPAARQRLLAEGVPRRPRSSRSSCGRACTATCPPSPASWGTGDRGGREPPAAAVRPVEIRAVAHVPRHCRPGPPAPPDARGAGAAAARRPALRGRRAAVRPRPD